jgi:hypothetical protein
VKGDVRVVIRPDIGGIVSALGQLDILR